VETAEQLSPSSGRRAVIRYRVRGLDGPDLAAVVGKVFAEPQRAQLVYEHLRVLSEALPATQGLGVPEPLALLPERGLVVYRHGEGTPLSGIHDPAEALRGVQAAARWLAQLHSSQVALPRRVDLAQEVKTTREWAELIAGIYPWAAAQARWVADHWAARATAPRTGRAVQLHRDFHPGHVLVGDRICVIDLDEARQGDAAFDIAHFCAYVELLMVVPADTGSEATLSAASLVSAFVEEYAAATGWADGGSVAGFTAYTWLKIAKQWATAAGPCRGASPEQRLDGVADALGRGESCLSG
jgi:aminoglycoside phosphotransferase (APT) family kinase protein